MRLCFLTLFYEQAWRTPADFLRIAPIHRELPLELAALGHEVESVHLFPEDREFQEDLVRFRFLRCRTGHRWWARLVSEMTGRAPALFENPRRALRAVGAANPDVVHFHGTLLHFGLQRLRKHWPELPLVIHHHGGDPVVRPWLRKIQKQNFADQTLLFSARELAEPFLESGVIESPDQVEELMESSTLFRWQDRRSARYESGMHGDPVFVATGRLHPVKDPLTLLRGFERILRTWPDARLYLAYSTEELLGKVESYLETHPKLDAAVERLGRLPHGELEAVYNSADFFLQCSQREWSGYAALEAMACGAIPILSDIPSFRAMTGRGQVGRIFPVGDHEAMAQSVLSFTREEIEEESARVRNHFQDTLSFAALARRLDRIYRKRLGESFEG